MRGDRKGQAVAELAKRHYERVYRYAFRLAGSSADAEDLCQETFVKAQEKLNQLREPAKATGWLLSICRNQYLQRCRRRQRLPEATLESLAELCDDPDPSFSLTEVDGEALQLALLELPEEFRSALLLFYFEELSYQEIAEQMQVPIGTVMSRLARGKAHLRRRLTPNQDAVSLSARPR